MKADTKLAITEISIWALFWSSCFFLIFTFCYTHSIQ